ncbi:type I-E CRISPR-associated endonuclease Cas1e [Schaalia sp. Marseille-Q2122]|uniref:type I-E CRISPR-associated endonuclease Cas1e n=1 Tax=Schaalia sp. Marseille-Q2122 TaxID=2736604 RepID=UPI00158DE40C|nr:type I-E CRISPR-associated endonuclease Cas1e [Schaalia sp. Marseille-Q2122]
MSTSLPLERDALPRVRDRLSFVYVEHCIVHRDSNALTMRDQEGVVHVPAAALSVLLLGPGSTVSHQAIALMAECGVSCVWVGENGVRYYAHGRSLAQSTRLLVAQARLVSHERERLRVAREMYAMRFPGEDVTGLTMRQLRGREGARMRDVYRANAQRTSVRWASRQYNPTDFDDSDPINQALSAANASLYGIVHAVIVSLGCSPGLGFIHAGHERSFVYDIADLYKADTSIPAAFDVVRDTGTEVTAAARHRIRDLLFEQKIIQRCVADVKSLLGEDLSDDDPSETQVASLWDVRAGAIEGGKNYAEE